jgi:hypothetical protein
MISYDGFNALRSVVQRLPDAVPSVHEHKYILDVDTEGFKHPEEHLIPSIILQSQRLIRLPLRSTPPPHVRAYRTCDREYRGQYHDTVAGLISADEPRKKKTDKLQAMLIPDRICTLSLVSTASQLFRTTGFVENLWNRANLFIPKSLDAQIEGVKKNLYSQAWLDGPDTLEPHTQAFPTNGDRFAANELWKRQHPEYFGKAGFMLQAIAAGWHHKSPEQLQEIAMNVGKKRIMVVHGTKDRMLTFPLGVVLWRGLERGEGVTGKENWLGVEEEEDVWREGEVEKHFIKGQGHVLPAEMREEFEGWIEGLIQRGVKLNEQEGV